MNDRTIARGIAAGRLLFGLAMIFAPRLLVVRRSGDGQDPSRPYMWWLRAFGIRDTVLGAGALVALESEDEDSARLWVQMGAAADTLDAVTAALYRNDLDRKGRWGTLAIAVPAAAGGWKASSGLGRGA